MRPGTWTGSVWSNSELLGRRGCTCPRRAGGSKAQQWLPRWFPSQAVAPTALCRSRHRRRRPGGTNRRPRRPTSSSRFIPHRPTRPATPPSAPWSPASTVPSTAWAALAVLPWTRPAPMSWSRVCGAGVDLGAGLGHPSDPAWSPRRPGGRSRQPVHRRRGRRCGRGRSGALGRLQPQGGLSHGRDCVPGSSNAAVPVPGRAAHAAGGRATIAACQRRWCRPGQASPVARAGAIAARSSAIMLTSRAISVPFRARRLCSGTVSHTDFVTWCVRGRLPSRNGAALTLRRPRAGPAGRLPRLTTILGLVLALTMGCLEAAARRPVRAAAARQSRRHRHMT